MAKNQIHVPIPAPLRHANDRLNDYVTRREMINGVSNAAIAVSQKMYDQFADETKAYLEQMERELQASIRQEFERRSWHGRMRALLRRVRASEPINLVPDGR
jgi:glutathionyl-hydroquinone reductase